MRKLLSVLALLPVLNSAGEWPQWRGPDRDGHAAPGEVIQVQKISIPKRVWARPIGGGFASPLVIKDKVLYVDENGSQEVAYCLDLETGKELWRREYAESFQDEWGAGPRATPFTDGERLYVQSCKGEFRCLDLKNGAILWGFSFEDYGVKFLGSKAREGTASRRGNNGSGLLDGDSVIVPVGNPEGATLVCLDKTTGQPRWKSGPDEAAYSSLVMANIAGARQVIALTAEALLGADRITGRILWRVPLVTNAKRHAMTPVVDGNRVYVNSHTFGLICFEISQQDGEFKAVQRWRNTEAKINLATPVLIGNHLYTHGAKENFICVETSGGETLWDEPGFGKHYSSALAAGEHLLILTDGGEGVVITPDPERFKEIARAQLAGKNWSHPALAGGRLVLRDHRELSCYDVR